MINQETKTAALGDTILFVGKDRKAFLRTLLPGGQLQTHFGVVKFDDLVDAVKTKLLLNLASQLSHKIYRDAREIRYLG